MQRFEKIDGCGRSESSALWTVARASWWAAESTVSHSSAGPGVFTLRLTTAVDAGVQVAVAEGAKVKARVAEQRRNRTALTKLRCAKPRMASMVVLVVEVLAVTAEASKAVVVAKAKRGAEAKALLMAGWLPAGAKVMPGRGRAVKTAATEPLKAAKAEAITLVRVAGAVDEMAQAGELAVMLPHLRGTASQSCDPHWAQFLHS